MNEAARFAARHDEADLRRLAAQVVEELSGQRGGSVWSRREARHDPPGDSVLSALDDPTRQVVVGTIDDVVVGYGVVRRDELRDGSRLGVIEDLFVEPEGRGIGIGELTMDLMVKWCLDQGCAGLEAFVLPGNRAAKNFFERFGLTARAILVHRSLVDETES